MDSLSKAVDRIEGHFIGNELVKSLDDSDDWRAYLIGTLQKRDVSKRLRSASVDCLDAVTAYPHSVEAFIQNLEYPGALDREFNITKAHQHTLEWIFKDPEPHGFQWASFVDWLENDTLSQLYWVTGKAASGKSTLVKYIYEHPFTIQALRKWSLDLPIIQIAFYFWNSGMPMQMSLLGLLQTILMEILRVRPEFIPVASRSRWEEYRLFGSIAPWEESETKDALVAVVEHCAKSSKLCIFIDGLDEFEENLRG